MAYIIPDMSGMPTPAGAPPCFSGTSATTASVVRMSSVGARRAPGGGRILPCQPPRISSTGWLAGFLWVLGMGLRFAFLVWSSHSGAAAVAHFSAAHSITDGSAWTDALLAMAVAEVAGHTGLLAARRQHARNAAPITA